MPNVPTSLRAAGAGAACALALLAAAVPAHALPAAPGDNGDIKVHEQGESAAREENNPKVCKFYLDAFNFDTLQQVDWTIERQPGNAVVASGTIVLTNGTGHTDLVPLSNGHYKVEWHFTGENGQGKMKVFTVACGSGGSTSGSSNTGGTSGSSANGHGTTPIGSVNAGGGGSSTGTHNTGELMAGGALFVLVTAGGVRYVVRRRGAGGDAADASS